VFEARGLGADRARMPGWSTLGAAQRFDVAPAFALRALRAGQSARPTASKRTNTAAGWRCGYACRSAVEHTRNPSAMAKVFAPGI
jgi:membrane-bound ClpP family serine protease